MDDPLAALKRELQDRFQHELYMRYDHAFMCGSLYPFETCGRDHITGADEFMIGLEKLRKEEATQHDVQAADQP